jgi:hypothetical protein
MALRSIFGLTAAGMTCILTQRPMMTKIMAPLTLVAYSGTNKKVGFCDALIDLDVVWLILRLLGGFEQVFEGFRTTDSAIPSFLYGFDASILQICRLCVDLTSNFRNLNYVPLVLCRILKFTGIRTVGNIELRNFSPNC